MHCTVFKSCNYQLLWTFGSCFAKLVRYLSPAKELLLVSKEPSMFFCIRVFCYLNIRKDTVEGIDVFPKSAH